MRSRYLVTYDVREPKRLHRMFKTLRGFGDSLQYSVFECRLSEQERVQLVAQITEVIKADEDRVMVVDLGPEEGRGDTCFQFLGCQPHPEEHGAVVV